MKRRPNNGPTFSRAERILKTDREQAADVTYAYKYAARHARGELERAKQSGNRQAVLDAHYDLGVAMREERALDTRGACRKGSRRKPEKDIDRYLSECERNGVQPVGVHPVIFEAWRDWRDCARPA